MGTTIKFSFSDKKFSLGKNEKLNSLETPAMKSLAQTDYSNEVQAQKPTVTHNEERKTITHNEEKISVVLFKAIWNMFR